MKAFCRKRPTPGHVESLSGGKKNVRAEKVLLDQYERISTSPTNHI